MDRRANDRQGGQHPRADVVEDAQASATRAEWIEQGAAALE